MSDLFYEKQKLKSGPVSCLGKTFANDLDRKEYYMSILSDKLKHPEFRNQNGFPIASDEAILALSNPPYYTACPNPFIAEFLDYFKLNQDPTLEYKKEPFAADVSEGKQQAIYNAHSYHTKVPHKAIMRYILHYTKPGDVILDAFCGTGMAGIAAQLCGDRSAVEELGYRVDDDGNVFERDAQANGSQAWTKFSEIGSRAVILNDLGPAATFIAYNYNNPVNIIGFEDKAKSIISSVWEKIGWMYETKHTDGQTGYINFTIWSDLFICRECGGEVNFWNSAIDKALAEVRDNFSCPHCSSDLSKRKLDRAWVNEFDEALGRVVKQKKQVPVIINYSLPGSSKRHEKIPDNYDLEIIKRVEQHQISNWYPSDEIPAGDKTGEPLSVGITNVHQFYTKRNLAALAEAFALIDDSSTKFLFTGFISGATKLNQLHLKNYIFGGGGANPGPRKGVIYSPSISLESCVPKIMEERLKTQIRGFSSLNQSRDGNFLITTGSASDVGVSANAKNCLDYVFIDPPFGSNLMYSELSHTWESWLQVFTNNKLEAIENRTQKKTTNAYRGIMEECFRNIYEMLKPGRWMTVEFSNTQAHVWNNIQSAISSAGFIIGNVSALDKKQGGINAIVGTTAVKQDLVISAYKPTSEIENKFSSKIEGSQNVWEFIRSHLNFIPCFKYSKGILEFIPERDPRILFDRMVSWYVRHNADVPLSSVEFQEGIRNLFPIRDGMVFLPEQVATYERKRALSEQAPQLELFVSDERTAIDWLTEFLRKRPSTYQEVHPEFTTQLGAGWRKHEERPELMSLLSDNFLRFDGEGDVPSQIHSYLSTNFKDLRGLEKEDIKLKSKAKDRWYVPDPSKAKDLEQKRERSMLKEFESYKSVPGRKLKEFRLEVLRAGFKTAWGAKDYKTIIGIAQKIPEEALQEDEKLLLWYDQALTRMEANA